MTMQGEEELASKKKPEKKDPPVRSPYSTWDTFLHGKSRGFSAHPTFQAHQTYPSRFLELSDDTY